MELNQLEQFVTAAQMQNFTKAAERLGYTQPALSKSIKALETELDCTLFDHLGRSVVLNQNGKLLMDYAIRILETVNEARQALNTSLSHRHRPISVSIHAASNLVPQILVEYSQMHKDTTFSLSQAMQNESIIRPDFTIDASLTPASGENSITLVKEDLLIVLPNSHPLSDREILSLDMLREENFVSLKKGFQLAEITEHYCSLYGFSPDIIFDSDNPSTLRNIISLGIGIALVPSITWDMSRYENLSLIPIGPLPCFRYINLTWPADRILTEEKTEFLNYLIDRFRKLR